MIGKHPVAVTGTGCISAVGEGLSESIDTMLRMERHPAPPQRFSTTHPIKYPVLEIDREYEPGVNPDEALRLRTTHLALTAARGALSDAGFTREDAQGLRVGVILGTTVGGTLNHETFYRGFRAGGAPGFQGFKRLMGDSPADAVAREFNLTGPRQIVVNACSSGTDAVGIGASWIRSGLCDAVLAGGADELCRVTYCGFISLMVTSDSPCLPFDVNRKGLNLGEAGAFLLLESEECLRKRGAKVKGRVHGYGSACDAHHLTAPHPEGRGLRLALKQALTQWGGKVSELAFINSHGTSTRDNDLVEGKVLADMLPKTPFHSTKAFTGHTLGAAGALEAAFTLGFLARGIAPGSLGFSEPDPAIGVAPFAQPLTLSGNYAISESLAFGGSNGVVVLGVDEGEGR